MAMRSADVGGDAGEVAAAALDVAVVEDAAVILGGPPSGPMF